MNPILIPSASPDRARRVALSIAAGALASVALLLTPVPSLAGCLPQGDATLTTQPACPAPGDSVKVRVEGWFPDGCWSPLKLDSSYAAADGVHLFATATHVGYSACPLVIIQYRFDVPLAHLPPGTHPILLIVNVLPKVDSSEFTGTYYCQGTVAVYALGDVDASGVLTLSDAIRLINHLFRGAPAPACDNGDVNCDGKLTTVDAIRLIQHMFKSGPPLPDSCGEVVIPEG